MDHLAMEQKVILGTIIAVAVVCSLCGFAFNVAPAAWLGGIATGAALWSWR